MVIPTHDKNTRATWISRLAAYKEVEQWARDLTHQTDTEWTEAFRAPEAEALADYFEAVNGLTDSLSMFGEFPETADFATWGEYLTLLRGAVEQMEDQLGSLPWNTDEAMRVRHWVRGSLVECEATYGRALIARAEEPAL